MISFGVGVASAGAWGENGRSSAGGGGVHGPSAAGRKIFSAASVSEQLVAQHAGERPTTTFNADGDITVIGGHPEPVATPNQAVALVSTTKIGGWQFWKVVRDGRHVPLAELRDQLAAQDTYERA